MKKQHDKQKSNNKNAEQGPEEPQDLAYNEQEDSYAMDVSDEDADWEHPMDYDTISKGAQDDDSTYDEANPYVGEEYTDGEDLKEETLEDNQMHIDRGEIVRLSDEDENIAENLEDQRDDLDEEGYPKNNEDPENK